MVKAIGKMGTCKFCNQQRILSAVQLPEGLTEEDIREDLLLDIYNEQATKECDCEKGKEWREKQKVDTLSDEAIEALTEKDSFLAELIAMGRNHMLMHPELAAISVKIVDQISLEQRDYKVKCDKDGNVIATRTDKTSTADIIN